jgi:hypothetical protein
MSETSLELSVAEKRISLSDIKVPYTIKNKILMAPGLWNQNNYTKDGLNEAFKRTNWSDRNMSLFLDHMDTGAREWIGHVTNLVQDETCGYTHGDLNIIDPVTALKLELGARFGVSPKIRGRLNNKNEVVGGFFENFSLVYEPACRMTFLNSSSVEDSVLPAFALSEELAEVSGMEAKRKEMGMTPEQFYACPRDPPSDSALPIFDEAHVRNAMARFNQTNFTSDSEKSSAKARITAKAKSYGIDASGFEELSQEVSLKMAEENVIDYGKVADVVAKKMAEEAERKAAEDAKKAEDAAKTAEVDAIKRERDEFKAKFEKMEQDRVAAEKARAEVKVEPAVSETHVITEDKAVMAPTIGGDNVRDADIEMLNWLRRKDGLPPAKFI